MSKKGWGIVAKLAKDGLYSLKMSSIRHIGLVERIKMKSNLGIRVLPLETQNSTGNKVVYDRQKYKTVIEHMKRSSCPKKSGRNRPTKISEVEKHKNGSANSFYKSSKPS